MIPPVIEIKRILFLNFFEILKNLLILYPDSIKGIANPREYELKSITPSLMVVSTAAKTKIDPRIGPMQGVQPKPKASPITNGNPKSLENSNVLNHLNSLSINFKLRKPIICSENKTTINPAIHLSSFEFFKNDFPINEAVAPNEIKTAENPSENKIVLIKILCRDVTISLRVCPEI